MAILKRVMTNKGPATYWVVGLLQLDNFGKTAFVKLMGFFDKEHAEMEGATPIDTAEINIYPDKYDDYFEGSTAIASAYQIFTENVIKTEATKEEPSIVLYDFTDGERG